MYRAMFSDSSCFHIVGYVPSYQMFCYGTQIFLGQDFYFYFDQCKKYETSFGVVSVIDIWLIEACFVISVDMKEWFLHHHLDLSIMWINVLLLFVSFND